MVRLDPYAKALWMLIARLCKSPLPLLVLLAIPAAAQAEDAASIKFSGRLYYDVARFDNDGRGKPERDNDDLRAAWLAASGKLYGFDYKIEGDFAGHRPVARDVYLARSFGTTTVTLGQFKQYFTLDDRASANHIPTIERSWLAQALAPTYRLGLGVNGYDRGVFWSGSVYSLESIDAWKVKGRGIGGRAGYAPWRDAGRVLHFGASLARENYDNPGAEGAAALRMQPRTAGYFGDNSRLTLFDFHDGHDVTAKKFGLEAAGVYQNVSWQGEYAGARYDGGQQQAKVRSAYLQGSWLITGESPSYDAKAGRFVQFKPARSSGAWELVARYDHIEGQQWPSTRTDLSAEAWTVGVNWYAQKHFRVMLDWTDSRRRDELRDSLLDHTGTLAARAQIDF